MVVSEGAISNIMGGMENTAGVRLHSHRHKLKQRFDILRKLGQGTYGKVQLAVNKDTGQEVAIKTIKKAKIETEQDLVRIRREIQIMSSVQHPQIIHIYEVFENREKMVLVMEYAAGGELYDYLSERKVLSVDEARRVFRQVASAVYYCHKHKICHRDLKLENILLDIEGNAKIADFGLSNVFDEKRRLDTFCGSPLYASPEIVKGVPYVGPEVDCWSLGVLLYTLVYGAMPFDGSNFRRLVKQITQGDFYEPPTPSTASPLIRSMLTVTAEKRANIADICSHWWVNDGESKSCLDEAEALANQTPVRLDLLLSLAPKHISSEHMLIQPEEDEASSSLAAAAPATSAANGPQAARSLSMGALSSVGRAETPSDMSAPATHREDEKRRRESEARSGGVKKRKEGTPASSVKPLTEVNEGKRPPSGARAAEEKKKPKKKVSKDSESGEKTEKKKSIKKKDSDASLMEIDENVEPVVTKKQDSSVEREGSCPEEVVKKSSSKKDTSVGKDAESKKSFKKKESKSRDVSRQSSQAMLEAGAEDDARELTPKAPSPMPDLLNEANKSNHSKSVAPESKNLKSPSNKSVISAVSTEGTLRASDSSLSTRLSPSPPKSVVEVPSKSPAIKQSSPAPSKPSADKLTKIPSGAKVPKMGSANKVNKNASAAKLAKNESSSKVDTPMSNGSCHSIEPPDTDEILKETATKIKQEPKKKSDVDNASLKKDSEAVESSKESSQHSSVVSTPARSRTGSESSNEARPGRQDSSRRGSKIFSKAAMWDTMCQQNEKPPSASTDKPRKTPRPGGLNMSDLTKKFEEKPPPERKKPVLSNFKISDVKKSFENKSTEKVGSGFRRMSSDSSGESKRDESLPTSPTRIGGKKEASLPPPGKAVKKSDSSATKEPELATGTKDVVEDKGSDQTRKSGKEKSPEANKATKEPLSPAKDAQKEKSPSKDTPVKRVVDVKREPTPSKRVSPVKDKTKTSSVSKKSSATQPSPRRDVVTPDVDRNATSQETKKQTTSKSKLQKAESSESSDSESEAEKLLRQLSERRERIEAAKKEKLRKVSLQQEESKDTSPTRDRIQRLCMANKEDGKDKGAEKPTSDKVEEVSKPVKPDSIPSASMVKDAEQPAGAKSATLPRGFKSKPTEKPKPIPQECTASPPSASLLKQITAIPPAEVLSSSLQTCVDGDNEENRRSTAEIVIKNRDASARQAEQDPTRRSSYAEIKLAAPQTPKPEYKAEVRHNVASVGRPSAPVQPSSRRASPPKPSGSNEGPLQRAPRERIIPIMMEDHEDDDRSTGSDDRPRSKNSSATSLSRGAGGESFMQSPLFKTRGPVAPHLGMFTGRSGSRSSVTSSLGSAADKPAAASPEPIRKSRRERIIPICVEGEEGTVSPPPLDPQTLPSSPLSQHQSSSSELGMGRSVPIARPESLSSNEDDEEEEDEDDGFQILTAESLFSTLLNRVRNLTRKMSQEDPRSRRLHHPLVPSSPLGFQFSTSPFNSGLHGLHNPLKQHDSFGSQDPGSSFWSSLYSPPRDLSRQNSELSSDGRGGERGGSGASLNKRGTGGSTWSDQRGSLSRDTSVDSQPPLQHEPGAPYNTLPRGWRARLSSDESVRRSPRRHGTEEGLPPRAGGMSRVGEDSGSEVFRKRSGEASGRVGGISEQASTSSARLASSGSITGPRDLRTKQTPLSSDLSSPISRLMGSSVSSSFSSAKNVPTAVGSVSLVVPKRSSSVTMSGPCEAKKQLQKLVEELEVPSEGSSPVTPHKQIDPVPPSASASPLVVSCTSRVRSPSPLPSSVSQTSGPVNSQNPAVSQNILPKSQEPTAKASSSLKIPEPVAKINAADGKQKPSDGKLQHTVPPSSDNCSVAQIPPATKEIGRKDSAVNLAAKKSVSDIPLTVRSINSNATMTKSLPPEEASSVLQPSKNNRYSVCLDVSSIGSPTSATVPQKKPLTGTLSTPVTGTAGNAMSVSTNSIEGSSQSSSLIKPSDSASSLRNKRTSLLVEPHKKLFPWEIAVTSGTVTEPTVTTVARQKSLLTPYRRGKSEDLRSAIDSVGKIDSSFERYKKAAAAATSTTADQPTIRPYKGSRSRELNPTIEAASEKLIQANPSNMKKISPFEAYRRSKTKELGSTIEQLQKQQVPQSQSALKLNLAHEPRTRMMSPPPPGLPQSPTSIARLSSPPPQSTASGSSPGSPPNSLAIAAAPQSPMDSSPRSEQMITSSTSNLPVDSPVRPEQAKTLVLPTGTSSPTNDQMSVLGSPVSSGPSSNRNSPIVAPNELRAENGSPTYSQVNGSAVMRAKTPFERAKNKIERKIDRAKSPTFFIETQKSNQNDDNMEIATKNMLQNELSSGDWYSDKDPSKLGENESIKKSGPSETEKPKSMYKKFTSKFSKSATNVSEDSSEQLDSITDDKFKLKRPSIFLKTKTDRTEKSPSRNSIAETDEQSEKKPSKKLSDALNKFLGRKTDEIPKPTQPVLAKPPSEIPSALTSDLARSERDLKKPSRYRAKVFSKSHENLNKYNDDEMKSVLSPSQSEDPNFTIESVTKSICDHLTQLESDITSRIGSMNNLESESNAGKAGVKQNRTAVTATSSTSLTSYGYSPALSTRRSTSVSVTTSSIGTGDATVVKKSVLPKKETTSAITLTTTVNSVRPQPTVTSTSLKQKSAVSEQSDDPKTKLEATESVNSVPEDVRCFSPTSWCSDGVTSAPDELQGVMSDDDEESVMDRITRKSFYSRFQDGKRRRSKVSQPLSKFDEDQQLAAAKARLLEDERKQRESLSPTRAMSPMSYTRTSIGSSIPEWEKSLPRRSVRSSVPRTTSLPISDYDPRLIASAENFNFSSSIGDSARSSVSRAAAAGAAAGAAAASYQASERETSVSRRVSTADAVVPGYRSVTTDSALSRMRSPSPPKSMWSPPHDAAVTSARDELSRRLTPLTRLASSREPSIRPYRRTTTTGDLNTLNEPPTTPSRPAVYRRTTTTGSYELPQETSSTLPRPSYRRTSTMDLPPADPAINRPSDYRRLLQPANRRYSTASHR